jgi:hypothetical protein
VRRLTSCVGRLSLVTSTTMLATAVAVIAMAKRRTDVLVIARGAMTTSRAAIRSSARAATNMAVSFTICRGHWVEEALHDVAAHEDHGADERTSQRVLHPSWD